MGRLYRDAQSCTRYYLLMWYDIYKRAMLGEDFGEPRWLGPPVPRRNTTHDALVVKWRAEKQARELAACRATNSC